MTATSRNLAAKRRTHQTGSPAGHDAAQPASRPASLRPVKHRPAWGCSSHSRRCLHIPMLDSLMNPGLFIRRASGIRDHAFTHVGQATIPGIGPNRLFDQMGQAPGAVHRVTRRDPGRCCFSVFAGGRFKDSGALRRLLRSRSNSPKGAVSKAREQSGCAGKRLPRPTGRRSTILTNRGMPTVPPKATRRPIETPPRKSQSSHNLQTGDISWHVEKRGPASSFRMVERCTG